MPEIGLLWIGQRCIRNHLRNEGICSIRKTERKHKALRSSVA